MVSAVSASKEYGAFPTLPRVFIPESGFFVFFAQQIAHVHELTGFPYWQVILAGVLGLRMLNLPFYFYAVRVFKDWHPTPDLLSMREAAHCTDWLRHEVPEGAAPSQ